MKVKVLQPVDVEVTYLDVHCGGRFYVEELYMEGPNGEIFSPETMSDIKNRFPDLVDEGEFYLCICLDNGKVMNWPDGWSANFRDMKIVDEGTYALYDGGRNLINVCGGYVPNILSIEEEGYGDYFEFVINNGVINNWKANANLIEELMSQDKY